MLPLFFINNAAIVFQPLCLKRSFFFGGNESRAYLTHLESKAKTDGGSHYQLVYNLAPREAVINGCLSTQ